MMLARCNNNGVAPRRPMAATTGPSESRFIEKHQPSVRRRAFLNALQVRRINGERFHQLDGTRLCFWGLQPKMQEGDRHDRVIVHLETASNHCATRGQVHSSVSNPAA